MNLQVHFCQIFSNKNVTANSYNHSNKPTFSCRLSNSPNTTDRRQLVGRKAKYTTPCRPQSYQKRSAPEFLRDNSRPISEDPATHTILRIAPHPRGYRTEVKHLN